MTVEKFESLLLAAAREAAKDLPMIAAQYSQGQNPEHAKRIRALETALALDPDMDPAMRQALEARVESMRPKLAWNRDAVLAMIRSVQHFPTQFDELQESVKALSTSLNRSVGSGIGGARGRKPGSTVERVEGAASKLRAIVYNTDGTPRASFEWRSDSKSAPATITRKLREQTAVVGVNYPQNALEPVVRSVIMGEQDSAKVTTPAGDLVAVLTRLV